MTCQGDESPIAQNKGKEPHPRNGRPATAIYQFALRYEGVTNEGQSIRQEDLQQVQNHQAKRNRSGYLREQKTQTEARLEEVEFWQESLV